MSGEHAPSLEESPATRVITNVEEYFELDSCRAWCDDNQYQNVALQFPDYLLAYSPMVRACFVSVFSVLHPQGSVQGSFLFSSRVAARPLFDERVI